MARYILGISAFYHDSAAALLRDGQIVAAAQEERFTRKKHDPRFPENAIRYVLDAGGIDLSQVESVAFYDKPFLKFERLLETYHATAPRGLASFLAAIPVWTREKLFLRRELSKSLGKIGPFQAELLCPEHHLSHAASAFYPSPFQDAAILTVDGVGEWATTVIGHGNGNSISFFKQMEFPHSLGLLYSAATYYCGFRVNSGEYKLMGLAPYGRDGSPRVESMKETILSELLDLREDGSFLLNLEHFRFATELKMCHDKNWERLFGFSRRAPESPLTQAHMDLAMAIQQVTEEAVLRLAATAKNLTGSDNLVMAGGVALNCVANGKLSRSGIFKNIWIQPASGDAGGALGSALSAWHIGKGMERTSSVLPSDSMLGSYLGPDIDSSDVERVIRKHGAAAKRFSNPAHLHQETARRLSEGRIVGWVQGRMEWGPRSLGARSILGDPRDPDMQRRLNVKTKFREGFRPFAPAVLEEKASEFFEMDSDSPYMLMVAPVKLHRRIAIPQDYDQLPMMDRLYFLRSDVPAITHVDYSARVQTVSSRTNPGFHGLLKAFEEITGIGMLVNTSFNVRGEPIVCSPEDAYRCFMRCDMDDLVVGDTLFVKEDQPTWKETKAWQDEFQLD